MGNSGSSPKPQTRSAAVPATPVIQCEHVLDPLQDSGDFPSKNKTRRKIGSRQWDSSKLTPVAFTSPPCSPPSKLDSTSELYNRQRSPPIELDATSVEVESVAALSSRRPSTIPLTAVTLFGDNERQKVAPRIEECQRQQLDVFPGAEPINEPGLTGVARHKPIQNLHPTPGGSKRHGVSSSPNHRQSRPSNRALPSSGFRTPKMGSGVGFSRKNSSDAMPQQKRMSQVAQNRLIQLEYEAMGTPMNKRAASLAPTTRVQPKPEIQRRGSFLSPSRRGPGIPQSRLEYTFYIRDTDDQRKPFDDNTADAIARGCQCTIELITLEKGCPPVYHKGMRVCPVTITTTNMNNLRRCLARLDNQFPNFNAKAFFPH